MEKIMCYYSLYFFNWKIPSDLCGAKAQHTYAYLFLCYLCFNFDNFLNTKINFDFENNLDIKFLSNKVTGYLSVCTEGSHGSFF